MSENSNQTSADELNVDFDNFSVPKERSEELRSAVQRVKDAGMVEGLQTLVAELGVEEVSSQDDQMAGLIKAKNPKVFRYVLNTESETERSVFEIFQFEQELRASVAGRPVLEVSFLPKDKDFLVFYVDAAFLENWKVFGAEIGDVLREAEKIKSDRQKHFKKFAKKEPVRHEDAEIPTEE
ncbi:MAG TPA: hypothetical protein VM901_13485 [Bdellovibrionota bacterium]|nr:hypothetical protein [Bdellovibrionota bacterium]